MRHPHDVVYKFVSRDKLVELLKNLPDGSAVLCNEITRNLTVVNGDCTAILGTVDFASEKVEIYGEPEGENDEED